MSSGVEGVTGDGEREREREGEEGDMGEIKKPRGICARDARTKRRRDANPARFRRYHLFYL